MINLDKSIKKFLDNCKYMKGLSDKTLKAYTIDLNQYESFCKNQNWQSKIQIECYIQNLYLNYKPKTSKRKIACLKTFFNYLENDEIIQNNPFQKINIKRREAIILPKVIPIGILEKILSLTYQNYNKEGKSDFYYKNSLRDIAVIELLFSTGLRVSELCNIKPNDINLKEKYIKVNGKGSKERYIQLTNNSVISVLKNYQSIFSFEIENKNNFFINNRGNNLSEQSVRFMINKFAKQVKSDIHITPHMFRHTIATLLLEENVDIRYIQEFLGHSSITTTQIYTHISLNAQKRILTEKHPRNKLKLNAEF